jgi:monoamine oxidase
MRQLGGRAEAGGTYIGAGYARVIDVAQRYGVELVDVTPVLEFVREQDLVLGTRIIRRTDWPADPANPFPEADKTQLPWNYHRTLTVRDNPLGSPSDWLDARFADLDVSARTWLRGLGLSDAAIALAYGMNASFGRDAHDVSALLSCFAARSRRRSARSRRRTSSASPRATACNGSRSHGGCAARGVELGRGVVGVALERERATVRCGDGRESAQNRSSRPCRPACCARSRSTRGCRGAGRGRGSDSVASRHADLPRPRKVLGERRLCRACSPIPARA